MANKAETLQNPGGQDAIDQFIEYEEIPDLDSLGRRIFQQIYFDFPAYEKFEQAQLLQARQQARAEETVALCQSIEQLASMAPHLGKRRSHRRPIK